MNKMELVAEIARRTNTSERSAKKRLDTFLEIIKDELAAGRKVQIYGFGIFEVKEYAARSGKNPKTGEPIELAPAKSPHFKAGKNFKERINIQ